MRSEDKRDQKFITHCYDNYPEQREFVFAMKGRPFSMLSTEKLPVPSSTLIDHNLVRELGLKLDDIQYTKFSYAGHRFRILGKISQTIQTVHNGVIFGTAHMRASVVENLSNIFDSHSIAGKKKAELLQPTAAAASTLAAPSTLRSPRSAASSRSESRSASRSPAPDCSGTRSPSAIQSSPPSASSLNDPKKRRKHRSPGNRAQPAQEHQAPRRFPTPSPDDLRGPIYGRIMKVSTAGQNTINTQVDFRGKSTGRIYTRTIKDVSPIRVSEGGDPYRLPRPGDAVLCTWHEGPQDNQEEPLDICCIYPKDLETILAIQGVMFPVIPPDRNPYGFYG